MRTPFTAATAQWTAESDSRRDRDLRADCRNRDVHRRAGKFKQGCRTGPGPWRAAKQTLRQARSDWRAPCHEEIDKIRHGEPFCPVKQTCSTLTTLNRGQGLCVRSRPGHAATRGVTAAQLRSLRSAKAAFNLDRHVGWTAAKTCPQLVPCSWAYIAALSFPRSRTA
jgi:hypothetical protein